MTPSIFFIALSFKVLGLDCATCAPPAVRALSAKKYGWGEGLVIELAPRR